MNEWWLLGGSIVMVVVQLTCGSSGLSFTAGAFVLLIMAQAAKSHNDKE